MYEETLTKIREAKPLIHHLTNWVTIYDCAQMTRAVGALPVMAHSEKEVADMTNAASALVLNIGTLTEPFVESMKIAAKKANEKKIPVVLDIVGCGATPLRSEKTVEILKDVHVDIIKGNSAEIASLAGAEAEVRGVEAIGLKGDIKDIAKELAKKENAVVVVTGKVDIITDGERVENCTYGDKIMGKLVGTGCMATSVIGSFAAASKDYVKSSLEALSFYGKRAELAAEKATGPMDFKNKFMDEVAR